MRLVKGYAEQQELNEVATAWLGDVTKSSRDFSAPLLYVNLVFHHQLLALRANVLGCAI